MRTYNANDACLIYQPAETIDRGLPMDDLGPARTGAERQTAVNVYRLPVSALQGASASSQDDRMRRSDSPATPRFPGTRGALSAGGANPRVLSTVWAPAGAAGWGSPHLALFYQLHCNGCLNVRPRA